MLQQPKSVKWFPQYPSAAADGGMNAASLMGQQCYFLFDVHLWCIYLYVLCLRLVSQSCPTLCDPMNCSMPGFPVHHQLPELTQTHVHRVGDTIQQSNPLSSPSPPAFNLFQHQGLFQWVSSSHQVAKVLEFHLPMNIQDWFPLGWTGWISLQSRGLSRVFSNTTVQKHQFFGPQLYL